MAASISTMNPTGCANQLGASSDTNSATPTPMRVASTSAVTDVTTVP